jgi:hypothetical protein
MDLAGAAGGITARRPVTVITGPRRGLDQPGHQQLA